MYRYLVGGITIALLAPAVALAHPDHAGGAPPHPVDSPEYHEVAAIAPTVESADTSRLALLTQLLAVLQARLAQLLGTDSATAPATASTEATDSTSTVATGDIEPVGDLSMTTDSAYRYFSSDGLPEYSISSTRYANTPSAQDHDYRVPLNPQQNSQPTYYELPYVFGIALNGVTFEPYAAEWYQNDRTSGWQEDPFVTLRDLDAYNAHVQPSGLYHYHGQPTNLLTGDRTTHSPVIGFASDGFPLYGPWVYQEADDPTSDLTELDSSYELRSGTRDSGPGGSYDGTYNEDYQYAAWGDNALDECNGRYGVTPEYPDGTYYYVATESYPYIPRCLWGDQDASFAAGPPNR